MPRPRAIVYIAAGVAIAGDATRRSPMLRTLIAAPTVATVPGVQ